MFEKLERGLFMCFLFAIVGVTGIFWKRIWDLREEQIQFLRLAEEVKTVRDETEVMEYAFRGEKDMLPEYKGLWEKNGDLAGWVSIDGTGIDYPVMWTPDDPEYYLHRNFEREKSYGGTPFAAGSGFDLGGEGCVFLYGHNMRNGSMFADLLKYREKSYWENHPIICLDSLWEHRRFRIFSVLYAKEEDWTEPEGLFYQRKPETKAEKADFFKRLKEAGFYGTGIEFEKDSVMVLLVTCSYQERDGRFVVAGIESDK